VRREAISVTLTQEQATSMIDSELAVIPNCETICRYSPPGVAYLFVHTDGPVYERAYAPTGLQSSDIVIEFDGQRFTQFAQVKEYLAQVRQRIEAGEQVTLTNHVLRGQFEELDVTFTVIQGERSQDSAP
jgi:PDZ domain-containing secreted protein